MQSFIATRGTEILARIRANTPEAAANRAARILYGRDAEAKRQTGKTGQAGDFIPSGAQAGARAEVFRVELASTVAVQVPRTVAAPATVAPTVARPQAAQPLIASSQASLFE